VLHAARHGGIPVIPGLRENPSIGQWWRLVTLAVFGDESIPPGAVSAALRALGFPEDFERFHKNSLSGFTAQPEGDAPVLFLWIRSASSPAWEWQPDKRVAAIMPPPQPDVVEADRAAIPDPDLVAREFRVLRRNAMRQAQIFSWRNFLLKLLLPWKRPARNLNFVECQEIGPEFDPSERIAGEVYLFGFGPAPSGVGDNVASPTGIADLLERIREIDQIQQTG